MLRERLRDLELRITELADYLQVSRPTMYKFIDYYDNKKFDLIDKNMLKLFNYISENELIGKKNVINYILSNFADIKDLGVEGELERFKTIKNYIISNPDSKKSQFIATCATSDLFDVAIGYFVGITPLLKKRKLSKAEGERIMPYKKMLETIKTKGE
ncbi:hypothetical protein CCY99_07335 [Helicobacter sp. 16-1353]|uniref:hypothetical protein n=1 Tax=Helicobacter sp. 16-1353 TaxID=2004996 RepID=UPI000DCF3750|nr:hypothetical protein [Helicobacter sp. 16-1353]RAX52453.1 hypothetical protein CCY99_07335 [Helicobacter sp. 16-1353]